MSRFTHAIIQLITTVMLVVFSITLSVAADRAPQEAKNLQIVIDFYNKALNDMDDVGMLAYLGKTYKNHNPNVEDGRDGFQKYIKDRRAKSPHARSEIKASFVEGDYVILHVHTVKEPDTRGNAVVDIFRLDNGKIVEHWDVVQPIPEKAANSNTMF